MAGDPSAEAGRDTDVGDRNPQAAHAVRSRGTLGYFRADNNNDILFVTSTQSGFGYFKNFGKTKRQGIEIGLYGTFWKKVTLGGGYTFLDATYGSAETLNGSRQQHQRCRLRPGRHHRDRAWRPDSSRHPGIC